MIGGVLQILSRRGAINLAVLPSRGANHRYPYLDGAHQRRMVGVGKIGLSITEVR